MAHCRHVLDVGDDALRPSGVDRADGKGGVGEDEEAATRDTGAEEVVGGGGDGEGLSEEDVVEGGVEAAEEKRPVGAAGSLVPENEPAAMTGVRLETGVGEGDDVRRGVLPVAVGAVEEVERRRLLNSPMSQTRSLLTAT
jgi:hypothetical protein